MVKAVPSPSDGQNNTGPQLTLPSRCYTEKDVFDAEMTSIFRRSWQLAGNAADVAANGTYFTTTVTGQDIAVIRGRDGVLRAFFNVCQHRGHRLLKGKGKLKLAITCPYHAWAYGLDGRLRAAPNADHVPGFDGSRVGLVPVGVEEVGPVILVNLDASAPGFDEQFPDVREELQEFAPRLSELTFFERSSSRYECNWKVGVENYAECYHCAHAHPTLTTSLLDPDAYKVELFDSHHRHSTGMTSGDSHLYDIDPSTGAHAKEFRAWLLWPNLSLQVNPGSNFVIFSFVPDGPQTSFVHVDWFFGPWVDDAERRRIIDEHRETTLIEDTHLVKEVQIGLNNLGYDRGVLMVDDTHRTSGKSEHPVAHFQNQWRNATQYSE